MADFTPEIEDALAEVKDNGELCEYLQYGDLSSNEPWADRNRVMPIARYNVWIAFPPIGQQTLYRSGSLIAKGGYTGLMGNNGFVPTLKDRIIRDGEPLSIKDMVAVKINEQTVLYTLSLDR